MRACWIHTGLAGNDLFFLSIDPSCYPKSVYSRHCGRPAHPARCKRIICQCRDQPVLRVLLTPFFYPFLPPPIGSPLGLFSFSPSFFLSFCAGSATKNRWYIDRDKPSATAAFDLDNSKNESHQHADMAFSVVDGKRSPPASVSARHPQRPPHTHFYSRGTKKKFCPTENISY